MANRFPLIINSTAKQIQELPSGDAMDLSGNDIVNANIISALDFNSTSDQSLKTNIKDVIGLDIVKQLHGVEFDFIGHNKHASGVIAQEIEKVIPHLVDSNGTHKVVAYQQIIPYLIEAIKDLSKELEELKQRLNK